jgi:glycosyltransferase involved in cell wall biosynthesis
MPVYNGQRYVKQAIQSLLAQTFSDFEIIVVDDGSTDQTAPIVKELATQDNRIRYFYQPNAGVVSARNFAIERSRSDFVALLDSDDIAHPNRLERQLRFMTENPEIIACGSFARQITTSGWPIATWEMPKSHSDIVDYLMHQGSSIINPSAIIRRKAFERAGMYDMSFSHGGEDYDMWCRFAGIGQLANIEEALIDYRVDPRSLTSTYEDRRLPSSMMIKNKLRISHGLQPLAEEQNREPRMLNLARQAKANGNWVSYSHLSFMHYRFIRGIQPVCMGIVEILIGRLRVRVGALKRLLKRRI